MQSSRPSSAKSGLSSAQRNGTPRPLESSRNADSTTESEDMKHPIELKHPPVKSKTIHSNLAHGDIITMTARVPVRSSLAAHDIVGGAETDSNSNNYAASSPSPSAHSKSNKTSNNIDSSRKGKSPSRSSNASRKSTAPLNRSVHGSGNDNGNGNGKQQYLMTQPTSSKASERDPRSFTVSAAESHKSMSRTRLRKSGSMDIEASQDIEAMLQNDAQPFRQIPLSEIAATFAEKKETDRRARMAEYSKPIAEKSTRYAKLSITKPKDEFAPDRDLTDSDRARIRRVDALVPELLHQLNPDKQIALRSPIKKRKPGILVPDARLQGSAAISTESAVPTSRKSRDSLLVTSMEQQDKSFLTGLNMEDDDGDDDDPSDARHNELLRQFEAQEKDDDFADEDLEHQQAILQASQKGHFTPRPVVQETVREMVSKRRSVFRYNLSVELRKREISRLDQLMREKEAQLNAFEKQLTADEKAFDDYVASCEQDLVSKLEATEHVVTENTHLISELRVLKQEISKCKKDNFSLDEQLTELRTYKRFLNSAAPREWLETEAMSARAQKDRDRSLRGLNNGAVRFSGNSPRSDSSGPRSESSMGNAPGQRGRPSLKHFASVAILPIKLARSFTNGKLISTYTPTAGDGGKRFGASPERSHTEANLRPSPTSNIPLTQKRAPAQGDVIDTVERLYFTKPEQLMQALASMEDENLFLMQNLELLEEQIDDMKRTRASKIDQMETLATQLREAETSLQARVAVHHNHLAAIAQAKKTVSTQKAAAKERSLEQVCQAILQVYNELHHEFRGHIGDHDTAQPLTILTLFEKILDRSLADVENLQLDVVLARERERMKHRREIAREQQAQQEKQQALERATRAQQRFEQVAAKASMKKTKKKMERTFLPGKETRHLSVDTSLETLPPPTVTTPTANGSMTAGADAFSTAAATAATSPKNIRAASAGRRSPGESHSLKKSAPNWTASLGVQWDSVSEFFA
ncbi:mitochondrial DUF4200 domain-containing protein [Andalucia godoyi]|uniref:Mitochondrial DUF4200 domain-containing protein n=1 Tax=Andalucia godoyi TaxID=505711 RepID=A0A8K0AH76_ANDGO|nr:mitochondrial DUF4200 domain-containing protein [Andalucia godoyi]|eukprot:ANDGO_03352.mRNA.1 mitochondrial DUF4200 domain-containing protein